MPQLYAWQKLWNSCSFWNKDNEYCGINYLKLCWENLVKKPTQHFNYLVTYKQILIPVVSVQLFCYNFNQMSNSNYLISEKQRNTFNTYDSLQESSLHLNTKSLIKIYQKIKTQLMSKIDIHEL